MSKPETLEDTISSLSGYVDAIFIRHPSPSSARAAARLADVPVVNCGNGSDEHPTQALTDLFTIQQLRGSIDGTTIAIVGDLRSMRSAHSLILALGRFTDIEVVGISPPELGMPDSYLHRYRAGGNTYRTSDSLVLDDLDIIYMAGFAPNTDFGTFNDDTRAPFQLLPADLRRLEPRTRVLCPLPRIDEIDPAVDNTHFAAYFAQSQLALWMRAAVMRSVLGLA